MKCPYCNSLNTKVSNGPSHYKNTVSIRRQRACNDCGYKFYTREMYCSKDLEAYFANDSGEDKTT